MNPFNSVSYDALCVGAEILIENIAGAVTCGVRKSMILRDTAVNRTGGWPFIPGMVVVRRRCEDEACPALVR